MDAEQILTSTQAQATAAWINWLNQIRLNELLAKLTAQDVNLEQALSELQKMKLNIQGIIESNRGGETGLHGFIAEPTEVGISNARNLVKGLGAICEWCNDNKDVDIIKNGTKLQLKFVRSGGHFGLEAIKKHLEDYPEYVAQGGKYMLPKDFYEQLRYLLSLSQEEAAKESTSTYQLWKWVHNFFDTNDISIDKLEPSLLNYDDVQKGKIGQTVQREERNVLETDQCRRDAAYGASKPSLQQGAQVAGVSATLEGGMAFCLGVAKKLKQGKYLSDFTADDWNDIGIDTMKKASQGGMRGAVVYGMTNFTTTPAAVANAFVTAAFGVVAQAYQLRQGAISTEDFIINSEVFCLDVSVSAVSSLLGQTVIPVPILGAIIGNVAGMFMYQIAKDNLAEKEQTLIRNYRKGFSDLNKPLEEQYRELAEKLKNGLSKFSSMLELAFDVDVNTAFDGSIALADYVGVPQNHVLRNKQDIDNYFLN